MGLQWLLVSGASRSGTTFLNKLLNTHPQIALFSETGIDHLVRKALDLFSAGRVVADSRAPLATFTPSAEDVATIVQSLSQRCFTKRDVKVIGDKMPNVNSEIEEGYTSLIGNLKKILILRRPSDVIKSSMLRVAYTRMGIDNWHVLSVHDAIVEWALFWEYVARVRQQPETLVVFYEDFQTSYLSELHRIARFLTLEADGFAQDMFSRQHSNSIEFHADEASIIGDILGPVESSMIDDPDSSLAAHPYIFPMIRLDQTIVTNNTWPCGSLFFKNGFSLLEEWGVWSSGRDAMMGFRVPPGLKRIFVTLNLTAFMGGRPYFDIFVRTAPTAEAKSFRIDQATNRTNIEVECPVPPHNVVMLYLHMPFVKESYEEPLIDPRSLGIGLFSFRASESSSICPI